MTIIFYLSKYFPEVFENQNFNNIDPGMVRNVNPGMDQGMVRTPPMGMR